MGKKSIYLFRLEFNYYLARGGKKMGGAGEKKNSEIIFLVTHLPDTTQRLLALRHRSLCCFILFSTKYLKIGEGRR